MGINWGCSRLKTVFYCKIHYIFRKSCIGKAYLQCFSVSVYSVSKKNLSSFRYLFVIIVEIFFLECMLHILFIVSPNNSKTIPTGFPYFYHYDQARYVNLYKIKWFAWILWSLSLILGIQNTRSVFFQAIWETFKCQVKKASLFGKVII